MKNRNHHIICCCVMPLILSLAIYMLFRPSNVVVNKLTPGFFLAVFPVKLPDHWLINSFIYNLPGALWLFAFLSAFRPLPDRIKRYSLIPLGFALGIELLQLLHITDGTYDITDVCFYLAAWLTFITINPSVRNNVEQFARPFSKRHRLILLFFVGIVLLSDVWWTR